MADARSNGNADGAVADAGTPRRARRPLRRAVEQAKTATTAGRPYATVPGTILPPPDYDLGWRQEVLDVDALNRMTPTRLLELLANLSPELSKGLWDYMRLLNPGWKCEVLNLGGTMPNPRGQQVVDALFDAMKETYGSADVVLGRLHMGAYMRGAYFAELALDAGGRVAVDIATPDPASVRFKLSEEPGSHQRWLLGQWQANQFVSLADEDLVMYVPVDPFPGNPYGRPLVAPAMFVALFLIGLLYDLRRVISQQGWPRIDIAINTTKLLEGLEQEGTAPTDEEIEARIAAAIRDVQYGYSILQPDDAYIHSDEVELKGPIGATSNGGLAGIEAVIEVVERMLVRALKTMPLMLGITDGVSEANANRQWEILVAGVKAMQHLAESMLERFLEMACQLQGIQADVKFEFSEIRAAEAQRDALTFSQEIDNQLKLVKAGIVDLEEAAMTLVRHPPAVPEEEQEADDAAEDDDPEADDAEEEDAGPEDDVQGSDENPEPGSNKAVASSLSRWLERQAGRRFVPAERPYLSADDVGDPAAYRAGLERAGYAYAGTRRIAHGDDAGRRRERWVPRGTWHVDGRAVMDEYDAYVAPDRRR